MIVLHNNRISKWLCFWEYLFSFLLVLELNSVYIQSYSFNFRISELLILISFILGGSSFNKAIINHKVIKVIFIYEIVALILLLFSVNDEFIITYIVKFIVFIPFLFIYYSINPNRISIILNNMFKIVVFLALMSLIFYIGGVILKIIPPSGHFLIDWGGVNNRIAYYGVLFIGQGQDIGTISILRNTGIYTEAPMYGCVLIMALATYLFLPLKNRKNISCWILCLTIISTISIAAIIVMLMMLTYKYYSKWSLKTKVLLSILIFPILIYTIWFLFLFKQNTGASYSIRADDYYAGYQAWIKNPLFGTGYGNMNEILKYVASYRLNRETIGYSNALMYILATIGLWGLAMYIIPFYVAIRKSIQYKTRNFSMIYVSLIGMLITTLFPMHLFLLNYVAMGLAFYVYNKQHFKNAIFFTT